MSYIVILMSFTAIFPSIGYVMVKECFSNRNCLMLIKANSTLRKQECTTGIQVQIYECVLVHEMLKSARFHIP